MVLEELIMTEEIKDENLDESTEETIEDEQVTLSKSEYEKRIEAESDRKLNKVLSREREKYEAQLEERVQKALSEDKRLSQLSETDRRAEELTAREKELAEKELNIKRTEIKNDAIAELVERKLPKEFVEYLSTDNEEETFNNIKQFDELFKKTLSDSIEDEIDKRFKASGRNLQDGAGNTVPNIQSFREMANEVNIRNK
jgi:hypothetical protein